MRFVFSLKSSPADVPKPFDVMTVTEAEAEVNAGILQPGCGCCEALWGCPLWHQLDVSAGRAAGGDAEVGQPGGGLVEIGRRIDDEFELILRGRLHECPDDIVSPAAIGMPLSPLAMFCGGC